MPYVIILCIIVEKVWLTLKFIADQQQYAAPADPRCWEPKQMYGSQSQSAKAQEFNKATRY